MSEQAIEIKYLRSSSAEISSASEIVPDYSPPITLSQRLNGRSPPFSKPKAEEDIPVSHINLTMLFIVHVLSQEFLKRVDLVKLANAKLQSDPGTAALKLMDCVFTTAELVNSNPSGVTKSKDPARQKTIKPLDPRKMKYIDGMHLYPTNPAIHYTLYPQMSFKRNGE